MKENSYPAIIESVIIAIAWSLSITLGNTRTCL
jgi:hypothetical protein